MGVVGVPGPGGIPHPRSGGVPSPSSEGVPGLGGTWSQVKGGYPVLGLGVTPSQVWGDTPSRPGQGGNPKMGYPPDLRWGTPDLGWGTPPQTWDGDPPRPGTRYPPGQT